MLRPVRRVRPRALALIVVLAILALTAAREQAAYAAETIRVPVDYPTIQAAIDAAQDGDVVLVSPGTYRERLEIRGKGITLASEFLTTGDQSSIDATILEAPEDPEAITIQTPVTAKTTIVGFTMVNASGEQIDGIKSSTQAEILNNHLVGFVDSLDLEPPHTGPATSFVVRNNVIESSVDDAVDLDGPITAVVEDNVLRASSEDGIEIRFHEHAGRLPIVIRGNTITGNRGDGIQLIDEAGVSDRFFTIERNLFAGNRRAGLGLMDNGASSEDFRAASLLDEIRLFNNTFVGHSHAVSGGDNLVAVNNLFVNSSTLGLKGVDGNSIASHNLFWGNGTDAASSNVEAATTMTADPLLRPDYTLDPDSPAIDAGTTTFTWQGREVLNLPPGSYSGAGPDLGALERESFQTTITDRPPASSNATEASFGFVSSVAGSTFECALDGAVFTSCTPPATYSGLGEGSHTFEVRAVAPDGTADSTPASFTWTVDTIPPQTTITSAPADPSSSASGSFTFMSSDPGSTFECALDGAPFAACTSPKAYTGLADGRHTFEVRATDAAGNVESSPATSTWTVALAVIVTLTPEADARVEQSHATTNYGTATSLSADTSPRRESYLRFTVAGLTRPVLSAKLRVFDFNGTADGPALYPTETSWSETAITWNAKPGRTGGVIQDKGANPTSTWVEYDVGSVVLGNGAYSFNLAPTSSDGADYHSREATQRRPELVLTLGSDTTAPETTIVSGPTGSVASALAGFTFSSSEPGSGFECSLDGAAFAACSSPQGYTGLAEGEHTFQVRATDPGGNTDSTPASRTWTVDTIQPATTIDGGPSGTVATRSATFAFSSDEQGSGFECSLDGVAFAGCSSPQSYTDLAEGGHTFQVRAVDGAGSADPTPASRMWTVDTTPPETSIDGGPSGTVATRSASFAFSSDEQGSGFECSLDGAAFAACSSPQAYAGLADGGHTFQVRAVDAVGNVDPTPAGRAWTVDTPPAVVTVAAAADARVERGSGNSNYGASSSLVADLSPQTETYLRFTITGVTGTVTSAKLRLYVTNSADNGPALYSAGNSWTETGITWNTKPPRTGEVLDNKASVGEGWVEYNVLAAVAAGNGTYTFNLVPESTDGLGARSREASSNRPQLVLETDQS